MFYRLIQNARGVEREFKLHIGQITSTQVDITFTATSAPTQRQLQSTLEESCILTFSFSKRSLSDATWWSRWRPTSLHKAQMS